MSLAADLTNVCMSGLHAWASAEMSRTPSMRPVNWSMIGAPVQAKGCSTSVKCSGPTTDTACPASSTVPTPLVPIFPSA